MLLVLGVILLGTGINLGGPAYLATLTREKERTLRVELYRTWGEVGALFAPLLLGWVIDRSRYSTALLIPAGLLLITPGCFAHLLSKGELYPGNQGGLKSSANSQPPFSLA